MSKITIEMIKAAYKEANDVYHKTKTRAIAIKELNNHHGIGIGSAGDFIDNFKKFMNGKTYTRTNSSETTKYYFESILLDYGPDKLSNALEATREHIKYYEALKTGGRLNKIRSLLEEYQAKLDILQYSPNAKYYSPDEITDKHKEYYEGAKKQITVNAYERNDRARKECIKHHGLNCKVCELNFEKVYGYIGKGFIHVHHINQLSEIKEGYQVNPIKDLVPVCPNCHAMLHKKKPAYTIKELSNLIKNK